MPATNELQGRDVYVRVVDRKAGSVVVTEHRAWDVDRFMASVQQQYREADAKDCDHGRHVVSLSDRDTYIKLNQREVFHK